MLVALAAGWASFPGVRSHRAVVVGAAAVVALVLVWSAGSVAGPSWPGALGWGVIAGVLCVQVAIDLATRTLPRQISYAGLLVGGPLLALAPVVPGGGVGAMAAGALAMTAITAVVAWAGRGALGIGDVHLSPLLGAGLGWFDPWLVVAAWVLTAVVGGVVIGGMLAWRRIDRRSRVAYGPFMVAGTLAAIVVSVVRP